MGCSEPVLHGVYIQCVLERALPGLGAYYYCIKLVIEGTKVGCRCYWMANGRGALFCFAVGGTGGYYEGRFGQWKKEYLRAA